MDEKASAPQYPDAGYPPQQEAYPPQAGYAPQAAYPSQGGYAPQPGYPPQQAGYPQQAAYPQGAYPQGAYPQGVYPQQQGQLVTEAPPPYYPQAQQQQQTHNVVVVSQPQVQAVHYGTRYNDYGTGALVFAIVITFFIIFFGCWWSLICSIAAIAFAANANSAGASGDLTTARSQNNLSIGCSIAGAVSTVVGIGVLIGIIFAAAASNTA